MKILDAIPGVVSSKEHVPIQAADMLAWSVRTRLEGSHDPEWEWIHEELNKTLWASIGYGEKTWEQIGRLLH
jgi:hypothetical protein